MAGVDGHASSEVEVRGEVEEPSSYRSPNENVS